MTDSKSPNGIGTLHEWSLHAALKEAYAEPDDLIEESIDGFVIDIVKKDMLIEIQTGNFRSFKNKLTKLLSKHIVKVVLPLAKEKMIVRETLDGSSVIGRRRSPKKEHYLHAFNELMSIPHLLVHSNLIVELVLTREIERKRKDWKGSWRRKGWSVVDRELVEIMERTTLKDEEDYRSLLPTFKEPFTTSDIAGQSRISKRLARRVAYTLRKMDIIQQVEKRGNAIVYDWV